MDLGDAFHGDDSIVWEGGAEGASVGGEAEDGDGGGGGPGVY